MAGLLGALTLAAIGPILVYIVPPRPKGSAKGRQTVTLQKALDAIAEGEGIQFQAPNGTAFVMADGGGDNSAGDLAFAGYVVKHQGQISVYAINCSHLGCSIGLDPASARFKCPCHGSQFALDGSVLHGPAQAPLSHLTWSQGSQPDQILIDGLTLGQGA